MDDVVCVSELNGGVVDRVLRGDVICVRRYHKPVAILIRQPRTRRDMELLISELRRMMRDGEEGSE